MTPERDEGLPPEEEKKKRKGMLAVAPKYAEQHPEAVTEIDGKFYRPTVSASESRAFKARGLTKEQAYAEKLNPPPPLVERDIPPLPENLWGLGSEKLPRGERARLRQEWLGKQGFTFQERKQALREQQLGQMPWLERLLSESAGTPGGIRGGEYVETSGLEADVPYNRDVLQPWFNKLDDYRQYNIENERKLESPNYDYWVRGAQLGLSPEAYDEMVDDFNARFAPAMQTFPLRGAGGEIFGEKEELVAPSREDIFAALTPVERYIFGLTDEAPEGYKSIPKGEKITKPGFYMKKVRWGARQTDQEWLQENFPSIAGERGGARPAAKGWSGIFTDGGRFAPRVKTLTF